MAASSTSRSLLLLAAAAAAIILALSSSLPCAAAKSGRRSPSSAHLTAGFTRVKLAESQFVVQKPYDVPLRERYEQSGGVRRMWVFASDKPISSSHPGGARTEIKVNKIYSSGVWQFEGDMFVPSGTSGASVMQIFGAATHATTLMLHVYGGRLTYYHQLTKVLAEHVYDRWVRLNVVHDVARGNVTAFVDGERKLSAAGHGGKEHYFKFGVYKQSRHQPSRRRLVRYLYV
ncbi:unnamed protein product [Urochloa decumbens]|uniref:Alginate lyase 2 domain-containing protein n=1 Tax=Urochloa decumbens TaxID=240449 RepID=A0ABC9ARK4_9POAL